MELNSEIKTQVQELKLSRLVSILVFAHINFKIIVFLTSPIAVHINTIAWSLIDYLSQISHKICVCKPIFPGAC